MTLRFSVLAGVVLALFLGIAPAQEVEIEVDWEIGDMIAHPQANLVYVFNETDGDLVAIDTENGSVAAQHRFDYYSEGCQLFISANGSVLWALLPEVRILYRLNTLDLSVIDTVDLGVTIRSFVIGGDGYLYATDQSGVTNYNRLVKIDPSLGNLAFAST